MRPALLLTALGLVSSTYAHEEHHVPISAQDIIKKGIAALGGQQALQSLKGVSSHCYEIRSTSLEESFVPQYPDTFIAESGNQTLSYDLTSDEVVQRIDKQYQISNYWYFGRQTLQPVEASVVTRGGSKGYSCYVSGNEGVYSDTYTPFGYVDPYFANVLLRDATRLSPKLLLMFAKANDVQATSLVSNKVAYPAVSSDSLNLTVGFQPDTYLPTIIRAYEDHKIYGKSTNDYKVYNYTTVSGIKFPRRIKIYYNENNMMLDSIYDKIEVNPLFPQDHFTGLPTNQINSTVFKQPPAPAQASGEYGTAELFENTQNMLWYGPYLGKISNVTVTKPHPELPDLWHLSFNDAPGYSTTILNFEDAVMVTDAPPHQSKLVIQWIKENLHKSPTHLLVTHHHHDHNYGAADYVAAGAKLVVPEEYKFYWSNIPGVKFEPVTKEKPFIHKTKKMQVRGVWPGVGQVHAADWMYYTFTVGCPNKNSLMAVEIADAWSPVFVGYLFDQFEATKYLRIASEHRMPKHNLVIPIHGIPSNATDLYDLAGFDYPEYGILDFQPGGPWC